MAQHGPVQLVYGQSTSRHGPRLPLSGLRPTNLRHLVICSPDESAQAEVRRDCHVVFAGSYYSAPYAYVGQKVDLYVYERVVQLFDGVNLLVTHQRATRKGERFTRTEHYPTEKALYLTRTPTVCRELAERIGPFCEEVVTHLFSVDRPTTNLRAAQALLRLAETYGKDHLEAACQRAVFFGRPLYVHVKNIMNAGLEYEPLPGQTLPLPPKRTYQHARHAAEFFESREVTTC